MPVVIGVGRTFFGFGSGLVAVGNFIRNIDYGTFAHRPTGITINSDSEITMSIEGVATNGTNYGILAQRNELSNVYEKKVVNTSASNEDFSFLALDIDSSGNFYASGYYESGASIYPALTKFDANGNILWSRYDSNAAGSIATSVSVSNSGILIGGGDWDATASTIETNYIAKYNATGNISWSRDISDVGNVYTSFVYKAIDTQSDGSNILVGDFEGSKHKGLISKYDTNGSLIWHKTLEYHGSYDVFVNGTYVDANNFIYVVGHISNISNSNYKRSFIIKYSPEGNILWQSQSKETGSEFFQNTDVFADDEVGSVYAIGLFKGVSNDTQLCITKYDKNGLLVFRRILNTNATSPADIRYASITATNVDLYVSFTDGDGSANVLYGRLSVSGNGNGQFEYQAGNGSTLTYTLISTPAFTYGSDDLGKLYEGTTTNLSSDFVTYPFSATKILFEDLATNYAAKYPVYEENNQNIISNTNTTSSTPSKVSSDEIVYGNNLLLNYDFDNDATYSGTGTSVNNLSSSSYTGTINGGAVFNSSGYLIFDGVDDYIINSSATGLPSGSSARTIEIWIYPISNTNNFVQIGSGSGSVYVFSSNLISGSTYLFTDGLNPTNNITISGTQIPTQNQWSHLVFKSTGQNWSYYKNASLVTSGTWPQLISTSGNKFIIGWRDDAAGQAKSNARYGAVRIYNKELSALEVSQNFNATRAKYGV